MNINYNCRIESERSRDNYDVHHKKMKKREWRDLGEFARVKSNLMSWTRVRMVECSRKK